MEHPSYTAKLEEKVAALEAKLAEANTAIIEGTKAFVALGRQMEAKLAKAHVANGMLDNDLVGTRAQRDALKAKLAEAQRLLTQAATDCEHYAERLTRQCDLTIAAENDRDALQATLEQAREAFQQIAVNHPGYSQEIAKRALADLDAGKEAPKQVILPGGCLAADSTQGPPGVGLKVEKEAGG